ncbi:signal peptidase II [Xanthovirga aplysinae]|uniref:signal peptidase II n=1 Tax=Xanthovirga aplysinae TaxID=2529853 RepID=UPI0012BC1851|nr:signal peptidase II [Xanthovirga aplysinae]MTI32869.1 signal peptidase II [Xanthovirga aplysinae]
MKLKKIFRTLIIIALLVSNIGCDQISKNAVRTNVNYGEKISLISNHLILTKIENTGAFLSLGVNFPETIKLVLLTILPIVVLLFMTYFLLVKQNLNKYSIISLSFIIGGGIGNVYDRVVYGSVTDFLHIDFVIFQTGVFNMADVSIMVGTLLLLYSNFFRSKFHRQFE